MLGYREQGLAPTVVVPTGQTVLHNRLVRINGLLGKASVPQAPHVATEGQAVAGESFVLLRVGVHRYDKAAGVEFTEFGQFVYWDETADEITNVATGNELVGLSMRVAAAGDAKADFLLLGDAAALLEGGLGVGDFGFAFIEGRDALAVSGAMTVVAGANGNWVGRRTAAASADTFRYPLSLASDSRVGRGATILGYSPIYSVDTADVAVDVTFELTTKLAPADNSAMAAPVVVAGELDAHYDSEHDTPAKRGDDTGAPEYHTALVTPPTPPQLADGQSAFIDANIDDTGGGTSVVDIYGFVVYFGLK